MSKWIDADALKEKIDSMWDGRPLSFLGARILATIDEAPSIGIVRCQDCKYWVYSFNGCARNPCTEPWYATDFCNYGERREP